MQACFRMCFIERANELLRKSAETALTDMIHLLFSRLHLFPTMESMKKPNNTRILQAQPPQTPHIIFEPPTPPRISEEERQVEPSPLPPIEVGTEENREEIKESESAEVIEEEQVQHGPAPEEDE